MVIVVWLVDWVCFALRCKSENKNCDTTALSDCHVLPDEVSITSTLSPAHHLSVERLARYTYRLLNRSAAQLPYIQFEVSRRASILWSVYPASSVKDDQSLLSHLIRRDHEWILHVEGQLQTCPGQSTWRHESIVQISPKTVIFENYIALGSVATQPRCGGIFSNHFPQNVPVKSVKIGQYLAKIRTKISGLLFTFLTHPVGYIHFLLKIPY